MKFPRISGGMSPLAFLSTKSFAPLTFSSFLYLIFLNLSCALCLVPCTLPLVTYFLLYIASILLIPQILV